MRIGPAAVMGSLLTTVGCGGGQSPGPPSAASPSPVATVAVAPPPAAEPEAPEPAAPEPEAPAPAPEAPAPEPESGFVATEIRTALEIAPGKTCKVVWRAGSHDVRDDGWLVTSIDAFRTAGGDACDAAPVYDATIGKKMACDGTPAGEECFYEHGLMGGFIPAMGTAPDGEFQGVLFADLDFDGYRDLCVQVMMGAYNYSQNCFLYRPERRTFEHYAPLDPVIWLTLVPAKQEIHHGLRIGGPTYMSAKYRWVKGELIVFQRTVATLGERETEERLIGGKMKTVYDGPPRP